MSIHQIPAINSGILQSDSANTPNAQMERDGNGDSYLATLYAATGVRSAGHLFLGPVAKSLSFTADTAATVYLVTTGSSAITCTLPAASTVSGQVYFIKKVDSGTGTVVIDGNASETIDFTLTKTIRSQWGFYAIQSNGTNWFIIGQNNRGVSASKTTSFTVDDSAEIWLCDTTAAGFTATLPPVAGYVGQRFTFISTTHANQLTIAGDGSENINGANTYTTGLNAVYGKVTVIGTATKWFVV